MFNYADKTETGTKGRTEVNVKRDRRGKMSPTSSLSKSANHREKWGGRIDR